MSLMRLLAAGSSLRNIKDRRSPYKMTQEHLLPKFGADKPVDDRVAATLSLTHTPPIDLGLKPASIRLEPAAPPEQPPMKTSDQTRNEEPSPSAAAPQVGEAATPSTEARTGGRLLRWARNRNPFQPRSVAKRGAAPVQAELLLESVKVVRNDLSDADLEVVARGNTASAPAPLAPGAVAPESAKLIWRRISTRLFGVRRT